MIGLHLDSDGIRMKPLPVAEQTLLEVGSCLLTVHHQLADEASAQRRLESRIINNLDPGLRRDDDLIRSS